MERTIFQYTVDNQRTPPNIRLLDKGWMWINMGVPVPQDRLSGYS